MVKDLLVSKIEESNEFVSLVRVVLDTREDDESSPGVVDTEVQDLSCLIPIDVDGRLFGATKENLQLVYG